MPEVASQLHLRANRWALSGRNALAALALALPILLTCASLLARRGYGLSAFGDLAQLFLLLTATFFFTWRAVLTRGTHRAFWLLLALGFGSWSINMFLWAYYEVWQNRPVPSIPVGEFLLFIKLVPMIAALALEPNNETPGRPRLLGILDISSLLVYWSYGYLFWATAYRFAGNDLAGYDRNSDIVDAVGNFSFLIILAIVVLRSRSPWRSFYRGFFGASLIYSIASFLLNDAIRGGRYYTGSIYDVPLTAAMAWFCILAITTRVDSNSQTPVTSDVAPSAPRAASRPVPWVARLSVLANLAIPMIGLRLVMTGDAEDPVRHFRVLLTLFTMLLVTLLLLAKHDLLNFKLSAKLHDASRAYLDLKKFQDQLVQNDKLASLGGLVARVAREIHGAMLAVNRDLQLLGSQSPADTNCLKMTSKIEESAIRTNNLVESMLSFAQEMPVNRTSVNVRKLLERAASLARTERRHRVHVEFHEQGDVPQVDVDANQLVQVFVHIIANAIDAMEGDEPGLLRVGIRSAQRSVEIEFADTGRGLKDPRRVFEPFYTTKPVGRGVGLGLSTCYGIIRQHGGEIACWNRREGGAVFKLVIPAAAPQAVETVI